MPLLFADIYWREVAARSGWSKHLAGILRGLAIGLPLVLFFGWLFMAADAVFSRLISEAFSFNGGHLATRLLLTICFMWLAGGFLRSLFLAHTVSVNAADFNANTAHCAKNEMEAGRNQYRTQERSSPR